MLSFPPSLILHQIGQLPSSIADLWVKGRSSVIVVVVMMVVDSGTDDLNSNDVDDGAIER